MSADVSMTFFANDKAAQDALVRLEKKFEKAENKIRHMQQASRRGQQSVVSGLQKWAIATGGVVGGYLSIQRVIGVVSQANRELVQEIEEAARKFDGIFRKLEVQSGLRGLEGQEAQARILGIAEARAVPVEQAGAAATQLVSSGFPVAEATGPALNEFLRIMNAANIRGADVDQTELAMAMAQFLESQGMEKTGQNIAELGQSVQALFKGTDVQVGDMSALAKEAASFAKQLQVPEQLAGFSVLREVMPAPQAATGIRNIVGRLSTAGVTPTRVRALKQMGISPEDVDFVGEDFLSVLRTLQEGLETVPEERRAGILKQLFEERGVAAANLLMEGMGKIEQRMDLMQDREQFEADVEHAESGRIAAGVRQQVRQERRRSAQDRQVDLLLEEVDMIQEERGVSPAMRSVRHMSATWLMGLGVDPDTAARLSFRGWRGELSDSTDLARDRVDQMMMGNQDLDEIIGRAREDMGLPRQRDDEINRNNNDRMERLQEENNRLQQQILDEQRRANQQRRPLNRNAHRE